MLRIITTPTSNQITLNLPIDLINKKVEFIAFSTDEITDCDGQIKAERVPFGLGCMENEIETSNDF